MIVKKSVFRGGECTMFSKKPRLFSRWRTRFEKGFSKMLYFRGDENRGKFDACIKRICAAKK